ncbi:MAG: site-specific DNA-methyltransferase [Gammaproteobacteria bacterium]|nr:site-specific DNA-methyltransferase [Gammaproteobacteria bacterium]
MPTLEFKGKQHIYAHHLTVPHRPLIPNHSLSLNPTGIEDNLIIHGDNLHALKALLPRYAGRVSCVYVDPPYNTGNEGWVYNDKVNSPMIQEWLKQNKPVEDEDLERHDKWLCMMWPRIHLLRELLAENGAIFVSIDDNELHHLRLLMDEVFGEENFFAVLTRRAMHTVRNSSKDFNLNADYVLVYAKNKSWFGESKDRYIRYISDKSASYPHDDNDGRGNYKFDPIHARNFFEPYTYVFANGIEWSPPKGRYPAYSEKTLRQKEVANEIDFSGKEPRAKRYLSEVQEGQPPDTFLSPETVGFNKDGTRELREIFGQGGVFPQPKPTKLIKFLLGILRNKEAIVLDSFAGSGTTAHAVLAQNREDGGSRKFILVECEEYADSITAERVRRIMNGIPEAKDESLREGFGGSFTYATLGDPIDVEGMLTGKSLPAYAELAAYLLNTASGLSVQEELRPQNENGLFYSHGDTDFYMLYRPEIGWLRSNDAILNEHQARQIHGAGRSAVVFAVDKFMGQRFLSDMRITFCQIPYELHRVG